MKWREVNFDRGIWIRTTSKTYYDSIVPLPFQVIEILNKVRVISGGGEYVFPNARLKNSSHMTGEAMLNTMRSLGITKKEATTNGFRATARTMLDEVLGVLPDIIEHQLGHLVRDPNGRAYNRTKFLENRRIMMQDWANYIDQLKK